MSMSSWTPPDTVRSTRTPRAWRSTRPASSRNASFVYSKRAEKNWIGAELRRTGRRPLIRISQAEMNRVSRVKKPSSGPPAIRPSGWQTRKRSSRLIVIAEGPTWTGNVTSVRLLRSSGRVGRARTTSRGGRPASVAAVARVALLEPALEPVRERQAVARRDERREGRRDRQDSDERNRADEQQQRQHERHPREPARRRDDEQRGDPRPQAERTVL